jgi:prophage DNA circulation protein
MEKWEQKMKNVASFGGARFYVSTVEYAAGRQTKKHTFAKTSSSGGSSSRGIGPKGVGRKVDAAIAAASGGAQPGSNVASSEIPYVEDLGGAPKMFTITGYWLESSLETGMDDYITARDNFLELVSTNESRNLILPTFGEFKAKPGKVTTKFNNKEGGIETFTAVFYRDNINFQPFFTEDTNSVLQAEADELTAILVAGMNELYSVTSPPAAVTTAGIPGIVQIPEDIGLSNFVAEDTTTTLERFRDRISSLTGLGQTKLAELNTLQQQLNGFSNGLTELILAPSELATSITGIVTQLSKIFTRPIDAFTAQKDLFSNFVDDIDDVLGDTLDAFSLRSNNSAIRSLVENSSGAEMMKNAGDEDFDSAEEALKRRDEITDLIDDLQYRNADVIATATSFLQMRTLLAASTRDITVRSASLPIVNYLQLNTTIPLLVIAYGLYEDATRFEEISSRNSIVNNLFPKTELEVLSS